MDIVPVGLQHCQELRAIYLGQVAGAPHCAFAPSQARFRDQLIGVAQRPSLYTPPQETRVFVAEEAGAARGFAAFSRFKDWDGSQHQAITGLFFADEAAGRALISACESAAAPGVLGAFPSAHGNTIVSEYNAGWDGLSDRIPDVARVLARAGYRPYTRELHLIGELRRVRGEPGSAIEEVTFREARDENGSMHVKALAGEQAAGECYFSTLAPLAEDPRAARTGYILWLNVHEAYRRRGIARALMAIALDRLAAQGCEECWLTTTADNWPAQPLYTSMGFEIVDCSACFQKTI
jgi:ribosomal protein S18 acetylase RimI-like enzyme